MKAVTLLWTQNILTLTQIAQFEHSPLLYSYTMGRIGLFLDWIVTLSLCIVRNKGVPGSEGSARSEPSPPYVPQLPPRRSDILVVPAALS